MQATCNIPLNKKITVNYGANESLISRIVVKDEIIFDFSIQHWVCLVLGCSVA